jgi:hypothetical protein
MRVFIAALVLIFSFQSWTKADEIGKFEIEGMSVGDSLLDYFSESEINNSKANFYKDNKYTQVEFNAIPSFNDYYAVDINYLTEDKEYIIKSISGIIDYREKKMSECKKELNIIFKELGEMFESWNKNEIVTVKHIADKSGKSFTTSGNYSSDQGFIAVSCHDYSEETGWMDHLGVSIKPTNFNKWLSSAF